MSDYTRKETGLLGIALAHHVDNLRENEMHESLIMVAEKLLEKVTVNYKAH